MPKMLISLNYLITGGAYLSCCLLRRHGVNYSKAARFMFFFGTAALLGGLVHHLERYEEPVVQFIQAVNAQLPGFVKPFAFDMILNRLWFITILCIGFAEFYFVYLFVEPIVDARLAFMKTWVKIALGTYCFITLFSTQYLVVVVFHVFSHVIIIAFSLYMFLARNVTQLLLLAFLALYNLAIGIMQQMMNHGALPTGPLHYNDWYHIGIIVFIAAMHMILTRGRLIESLAAMKPPVKHEGGE